MPNSEVFSPNSKARLPNSENFSPKGEIIWPLGKNISDRGLEGFFYLKSCPPYFGG